MSDNHGLTLLESELDEIMRACEQVKLDAPRTDCAPEFERMWNRAEASPLYWLELLLLQVDEERIELKSQIKAKGHGIRCPDEFWQWMTGQVSGLSLARKLIKRLIRKQLKGKQCTTQNQKNAARAAAGKSRP